MKVLTKKLIYNNFIFINKILKRKMEKLIHNNEYERINDLLCEKINSISGNTLQEKLITLSKCNCCSRHSINKPFMFSPWVETTWKNKSPEFKPDCQCSCRHDARIICRQHSDYNDESMYPELNIINKIREERFTNKLKQRDADFIKKFS